MHVSVLLLGCNTHIRETTFFFFFWFCLCFPNKHIQTLKFKPNINLGPLWYTMTTKDKMPINKHKSKQQVVTFFININKHNQYSHSITCNIDHWLITQKTIKQPQAQIKNPNSDQLLTRILVPWTTRYSSKFILAALFQYQMQNGVSIRIFVFLGLVRKRVNGSCFWSMLCSDF